VPVATSCDQLGDQPSNVLLERRFIRYIVDHEQLQRAVRVEDDEIAQPLRLIDVDEPSLEMFEDRRAMRLRRDEQAGCPSRSISPVES
jgi:hypothetical protein